MSRPAKSSSLAIKLGERKIWSKSELRMTMMISSLMWLSQIRTTSQWSIKHRKAALRFRRCHWRTSSSRRLSALCEGLRKGMLISISMLIWAQRRSRSWLLNLSGKTNTWAVKRLRSLIRQALIYALWKRKKYKSQSQAVSSDHLLTIVWKIAIRPKLSRKEVISLALTISHLGRRISHRQTSVRMTRWESLQRIGFHLRQRRLV